MSTLRKVAIAIVAAIVAAYPVQKLVAESWDASTMVIWMTWLALTLGIWLVICGALARRQRHIK
jgi:hypothetical protein